MPARSFPLAFISPCVSPPALPRHSRNGAIVLLLSSSRFSASYRPAHFIIICLYANDDGRRCCCRCCCCFSRCRSRRRDRGKLGTRERVSLAIERNARADVIRRCRLPSSRDGDAENTRESGARSSRASRPLLVGSRVFPALAPLPHAVENERGAGACLRNVASR